MTLRGKSLFSLGLLFAALAVVLALLQGRLLDELLLHQTSLQMRQSARAARELLRSRAEGLAALAGLMAESALPPDREAAGAALRSLAARWKLSLAYLEEDGRVVASGGAALERGVLPDAAGGFALVPGPQGEALALFASAPVPGGKAVLRLAQVLDGDQALVEAIRSAQFAGGDGRQGAATLFRGDVRVATTLSLPDGHLAVGTRASPLVAARVLGEGRPWNDRVQVLGEWYLSAYEPLRDPAGKVVGMLYVGEREAPLLAEKRRALLSGTALLSAILLLAFAASWAMSGRLVGRVVGLQQATARLASGQLSARADETGTGELAGLARAFNRMAAELERDRGELLSQKERVEAANRNYLETLGFVSHELRNGLGTALFTLATLQEGAYGDLGAEQQQGLGLVHDSLEYLSRLMLNHLQLSRIEKGELLLKQTAVALARDVARPAAAGLEAAFAARHMPLVLDIADDVDVLADVSLLRVVFENLLGNAQKYGRDGGRVEVSAKVDGDRVRISVFNEGPGIDAAHRERLFRKFEHFDVDQPGGQRGTGLGLFIVRQILQRHGSDIAVESEPGQWVRFTFALARSAPPEL